MLNADWIFISVDWTLMSIQNSKKEFIDDEKTKIFRYGILFWELWESSFC